MPKAATSLECDDLLTVSSSQPTKASKVAQRMTATGNAKFANEKYIGLGGTITDDSDKYVFDGTPQRPAQLFTKKTGVNEKQSHAAEQITYRKNGDISTKGSTGGTIINSGR